MRTLRRTILLTACLCMAFQGRAEPASGDETRLRVSDIDESTCFEIEREPGEEGGLRIPRQTVCPSAAPTKAPRGCSDELGEEDAATLVKWCIDVSPATHPPCHSSNPCYLIVDEIRRGCRFLKNADAPFYCLVTYGSEPK